MQSSSSSTKFNKLPDLSKTLDKFRKLKDPIHKQDTSLTSFDLYPNDDQDFEIVSKIITETSDFDRSSMTGRALASFIGAALGDSLGSFTEFAEVDYKRNFLKGFENVAEVLKKTDLDYLRNEPGQFTDDTAQAICVADSILYNNYDYNGKDLRFRILMWWMTGYNGCRGEETSLGLGMSTKNTLLDFIRDGGDITKGAGKNGNDNGNGSVMRLSPVPIGFADDLEKCLEYAEKQSYATHNGYEAAECCKLLSFITWHFLRAENEAECRKILDDLWKLYNTECPGVQAIAESKMESEQNMKLYNAKFNSSTKDRNWNWKDPEFKYSFTRAVQNTRYIGSYTMDATAMALHCIYHTKSYREAILKVANMGGDADSVGAIAGMLTGAMYGYNDEIKEWYTMYMTNWDKMRIAMRAFKLIQGALNRIEENKSKNKTK